METKKILAAVCAAAMSFGAFQLPSAPSVMISAGAITPAISGTAELGLGDVNGDKTVDSRDASAVLEEYSRLSTGHKTYFTAEQKKAADVNKSGSIDSVDASLILAYYSYVSTGGKLSFEDYLKTNNTDPPVTTTTTKATTAATTTTTKATTAATTTTKATTAATTTTSKPAVTTTTTSKPAATTTTTTTTKPVTTTTTTTTAATTTTTTTTTKATTTTTTTTQPTTTTTTTTTAATTTTTTTTAATTTTTSTTTAPVTTTDPDHVSSIKLSKYFLDVNVGEGALAAYVTMFPVTAKNKAEIWTSDNEAVAIVDKEGWVIGIGEGECTVTVTSVDNPSVTAQVEVKVTDTSTVKEIRLSRYTMALEEGTGALSANVTMLPTTAKDKGEIWSSDNEAVAYPDSEGWVVGVAPGSCTITVQSKSNPEIKAQIKVTVYAKGSTTQTTVTTQTTTSSTTTATVPTAPPDPTKVSEIHLSITDMVLKVGERGISYVTMLPETAANKDELWASTDETVAVVDDYGNITALKEGSCAIIVTSADNPKVSAKVNLTVTDPNRVNSIKLSTYELVIPLGTVDVSYVTMLPESAPNKGEIWVCSDETIASVDKDGWVYGRRIGECTVTVYSQDNPKVKAEIHVKIIDKDDLSSFISDRIQDDGKIGFVTLLPEKYKGRYVIDYIITDANGKLTTVTSSTILIPEMNSVISGLTADTNKFTVTSYVTNLNNTVRARIGIYHFDKINNTVITESEEIAKAFEYVTTHNE